MNAKHFAFTGTRQGLTDAQGKVLAHALLDLRGWVMHNGCAEGADESALRLWGTMPESEGVKLWPCNAERKRWVSELMFSGEFDNFVIMNTSPPLTRNRHMVGLSTLLVACPAGPETPHGGTWYTIRYARSRGVEIRIIWPDGTVTVENGT
jgi:hypothetical protein